MIPALLCFASTPLTGPFDGSYVVGTPYTQTGAVRLPLIRVHTAVVDLHVILVRKPLPAKSTSLEKLLLEGVGRVVEQNLREHNFICKDLGNQRGVHVIIVSTGGSLAPTKFDMPLEFLPHAKFVPTVDTLRESVLTM